MNGIIPGDIPGRCFLCGRRGATEVHHMMHGSRRAMAEQYGLKVHLCRRCHAALHDAGQYDRDLETLAQETFERDHTRAEWMRIFGKNYREDEANPAQNELDDNLSTQQSKTRNREKKYSE